uniref:ATP synthase complex subunit 8 n=1 Tax=Helogenes marmoratus TaxID=337700 RepID=F7UJL0_9TELE|nr:ATPase subunit 8 [Helogenes marmoratus]
MPQLIPAPWFAILLFSWLILATTPPSKIMHHTFPNVLTPPTAKTLNQPNWSWPWP